MAATATATKPSESQAYVRLLVSSRSNVQNLLLDLQTFLQDHRALLEANSVSRSIFVLLVGTAFSLWRAVFLADSARDWSSMLDHAGTFLDTLIRDNAILYKDDKENAAWSV